MKFRFWERQHKLTQADKKQSRKERFLLILSGILLSISFPPVPFPAPIILFFALIPYLIVIEKKEKLIEINRATYLMAFVFCLFTLYWVGSWQESADVFLMISGTLLIFVNPIFFLIPSTLLYFSRSVIPKKYSLYLLPLFFVAYEYAYMLTDLSFPWLSLGNGLSLFTLVIQIADIIGQLGLTIVVVLVNVFLFKSLVSFRSSKKVFYTNVMLFSFLTILLLLYGEMKLNTPIKSNEKIKVGLIQPNLDPWEKWHGQNLDDLTDLYIELSTAAVKDGASIIIWPETALPVYLRSGNYQEIIDAIHQFVDSNKVSLLTGMPDIQFYQKNEILPDDAKYNSANDFYYATYNAILLFNPGNRLVETYGKMKLVPFGERVPFVDALPFLGKIIKWGVGISGWNVGKDTTIFSMPNLINKGLDQRDSDTIKVCGLVCYESIYPTLVAQFVKKGADFIAVVTNDSWYGNLSGPYQHKDFAALRAVENRRTVVRAANGGISCIINPLGVTEIQTKMFTKTYIVGDVVINNSKTFYSENALLIPVISSVISIWIFGMFILIKLKNRYKL